jgi:hypothetical protein
LFCMASVLLFCWQNKWHLVGFCSSVTAMSDLQSLQQMSDRGCVR